MYCLKVEIINLHISKHTLYDKHDFFVFKLLLIVCTYCYQEEGKRDFVTNYLPVKLKQWEAFLGDRQWLAGDKVSLM